LPALPASRDADTTAQWIDDVLAGKIAVPEQITRQVNVILRIVAAQPA